METNLNKTFLSRVQKVDLICVVNRCRCYSDILVYFNLAVSGANRKNLKNILNNFNISHEHLARGKTTFLKHRPLEEYLVENAKVTSGSSLKRKLIKANLLEDKCVKCGLGNIWNNLPITLQLDHINGDRTNNTLNNLRVLCPNCHTQTDTYAGKNTTKKETNLPNLEPKKLYNISNYKPREGGRKVHRPEKDILEKLVWEKPTTHIAADLGVTDTAITKWCKYYGIIKPTRGYWTKQLYADVL